MGDVEVIVVDILRLEFTMNCLRNIVICFLLFSIVGEDVVVVVNDGEEGLARRLYLTVDDFFEALSVVG